MARRNVSFSPRPGKALEKQPPITIAQESAPPAVVENSVKKPVQPLQPRQNWDAESTSSYVTEDGERFKHCEQLKREAPPSDTKRASVTTVKRIKTSPGHKFTQRNSTHSSSTEHQRDQASDSFEKNVTGALLASAAQQLGSQRSTKPSVHFQSRSLNHVSLAATKQILKNFVHSRVLSTTPPRRFTRRSHGARDVKAHPKLLLGESSVRRKMDSGPLYNLTLAETKFKAGWSVDVEFLHKLKISLQKISGSDEGEHDRDCCSTIFQFCGGLFVLVSCIMMWIHNIYATPALVL